MKKIISFCMLCLVGVVFGREAVSTNAAAASTNQTIITSDRLEYDYPRALAVFTGNVLVRDKDMKMWSDKMTVIMTPEDEIESVTAIGRVFIVQPGRKARCRKAIFLVDRNEVVLTGDAVIEQEKDRVEGRVIHIWTDSDRMVSEPGHLVVFPKDERPKEGDQRTENREQKPEDGSRTSEREESPSPPPTSDIRSPISGL